ncbi:MAG: GDP-mannose 4,6-dehydratase [Chlorobiales bacterium]|nr:GDP-mannose 4,6-dehydratase [Chlorobiales bacterium]
MKKALITGISGQDGSYLAEFLLSKGYEVHGIVRRTSITQRNRVDHLHDDPAYKDRFFLHYGDLADGASLTNVISQTKPDEVYNLAAQSHVKVSFEVPKYTADVTATGTLLLLEAIRQANINTKFYQASSSEMFGKVQAIPQTETTPFYPRSPYGVAKLYSHWITINYRESYGMFACSGILFNHESPRRGESFVTRKVTQAVARIKKGLQKDLVLGNMEARRDWGYAKEYIEGMWLMLQQPKPDDYVLATNETHTIRELVEEAFSYAGLDWREFVKTSPAYERPSEVDLLIGDYSKAKAVLGWEPKTKFRDLIRLMVDADLEAVSHHPITHV